VDAPDDMPRWPEWALALLPLVGLGQGGIAAWAARALATVPWTGALLGLLVLETVAGFRPSRGVFRAGASPVPGVLLAIGVLAVRWWGLAVLEEPGRAWALMLGPLLGRWALVVQCYGRTGAGSVGFTAFAWASVLALGATQAIGGGVGVLLVLVVGLVTVGARVAVHRHLGGFTRALLWATDALVETAVVGTLGLLTQLKT